jgi:hypothetical protein
MGVHVERIEEIINSRTFFLFEAPSLFQNFKCETASQETISKTVIFDGVLNSS